MKGMPFGLAGKGLLEVEAAAEDLWWIIGHAPTNSSRSSVGVGKKEGFEPRSVLDNGRSPSPPTSASTLSSSLGGSGSTDSAGFAAVSGNPPHRWLPTLGVTGSSMVEAAVGGGLGVEGWESVIWEPPPAAAASPGPDQSLLRWVMGEIDDPSPAVGLKREEPHQMMSQAPLGFEAGDGGGGFGLVDPVFCCGVSSGTGSGASGSMAAPPPLASSPPVASAGEFSLMDGDNGDASNGNRVLPIPPCPAPLSLPLGVALQEQTMEEKPHFFSPNLLLNHQQEHFPQNYAFRQQQDLLLPPPPKRHHFMVDHRSQIPPGVPFCEEALVDQLFKAAELVEAGNFVSAHVVLARLNHQLSPVGKPLVRSAFYCKEALQSIITNNSTSKPPSTSLPLQRNPSCLALSTPVDVVLKLSAYKAFSEISPILQFANFTCTQALLEELNGCNRIHIIDFDIGVGGQWSSFMQELAQRRCGATAAAPSLKITAIVPLSSHDSFELALTRENLSHFAGGLNIPFEFNILSNDPFDLPSLLNMLQSDEAIAVNLPVSSAYPSIPNILCLVKQLSPKILVSVDHGWDHNGFMFSHHFLHVLHSATILLDSIDAAGISPVVASKIERYLLQPRIENAVVGHHYAAVKGLSWRTLFASAGFTAVPFSNFTEAQAECLLMRTQVRGFLLEKRQSSLLLCWHNGALVSVSAWKC